MDSAAFMRTFLKASLCPLYSWDGEIFVEPFLPDIYKTIARPLRKRVVSYICGREGAQNRRKPFTWSFT